MKQHTIQLLLAFFAGMIAYKMLFSREGFDLSVLAPTGVLDAVTQGPGRRAVSGVLGTEKSFIDSL